METLHVMRLAMRILAVITEPDEVCKVLRHLLKVGCSPTIPDPNFV